MWSFGTKIKKNMYINYKILVSAYAPTLASNQVKIFQELQLKN